MTFRLLRSDEIEIRIGSTYENKITFLLYKDARCDMNILDETVGAENWQRRHARENANCIVSIWCNDKQQWIDKEDTGKESNTEKEKGLASDSFKRACVNWGIGRELYTAPSIDIYSPRIEITKTKQGTFTTYDKLKVEKIVYNEEKKSIIALSIINKKSGARVFSWMDKEEIEQMKNKQKTEKGAPQE